MTAQSSDTENNQKVCKEFAALYDRSKNLFNIIRELPQYGHEQWCSFFQRAFDCHTKLWRYQQLHRAVLEQHYGLQRWQIGEMAHRIAQLYFLYYLRSSDTTYLYESLSFYRAIGVRKYYSKPSNDSKTEDMSLKRLRYFIRYMVVCVLLGKLDLLRGIINEMQKEINYNQLTFHGNMSDWRSILEEVQRFLPCLQVVNILPLEGQQGRGNGHRKDYHNVRAMPLLPGGDTPANIVPSGNGKTIASFVSQQPWRLCEAVLIGNTLEQVKCGEVSIDMYRMMLTLERDPISEALSKSRGGAPPSSEDSKTPSEQNNNNNSNKAQEQEKETAIEIPQKVQTANPHKYVLYKPSYAETQCFFASSIKALPPDGVLLIYLSMDGKFERTSTQHARDPVGHVDPAGFSKGGLRTNVRREFELTPQQEKSITAKDPCCIYPGDLYSLTRRPLFLIVDSDNSKAFQNFPSLFGQPLVVLLSPELSPPHYIEQRANGNLLTLFLHHPLDALCYLCDVVEIAATVWEQLDRCFQRFMTECYLILIRSKLLPFHFREFMGDGFLLALILRFLFCGVVYRLHRDFSGDRFYPSSQPDLSECTDVYHSPILQKYVLDMASLLKSRERFATSDDLTSKD